MDAVYKHAVAVLVIDSDLQLIDDSRSLASVAIDIAASVWFTRLWMIQEAAFAKELFFQLESYATQESVLRQLTIQYQNSWDLNGVVVEDILRKLSACSLRTSELQKGCHFSDL